MTRERENELLALRQKFRRRRLELIQAIVEARLKGEQDLDAMAELKRLSAEEVKLTKPDFDGVEAA